MKTFAIWMLAAATTVTLAFSVTADAKRLGGGGSLGAQRQSIAPKPPATAPNAAAQPVMPAQPGAALPAKPAVFIITFNSAWSGCMRIDSAR